jgi:CRP-like cAMP-binding protein
MIEPLLMKLELRDRLHPEEKDALVMSVTPRRRYAAGDEMVAQGSSPDESTLLLEGTTARVSLLRGGEQQITSLHIPGDFVDLHSFLLRRMDHSIVALHDCTVTTVPHSRLRDLTSRYPHLGRLLWLNTLLDAAIHRQWLTAMGRRDSLGQTAHLICEQFLRLEVVARTAGQTFEFPLNQAELADTLGRSRATINGVVQELRARRLITWDRLHVRILDWEGLADVAEFDPTYLQLEAMPV